jgi:D-alanyl-D-alanine carboxypeptidase
MPYVTFADSTDSNLNIKSESALLMDAATGEVLYEKNSTSKMYPASLTKTATAIVAIEQGNLDDIVTVSKKARNVEGTRVYLEEGEQVTLLKLVQGTLINSYADTVSMLDFGFENYETITIVAGTSFKNNEEQTVYTPFPLHYTKEKGTAVNLRVNDSNELIVTDEDNTILLEGVSLGVKEDNQELKADKAIKSETTKSSSNVGNIFFTIFIVLSIFSFVLFKRHQQKRENDISM